MTHTHTEHTNLPVIQRGHQHTSMFHNPEQTLNAMISEFDDGTRFAPVVHTVFSCNWCDAYPGFEVTGKASDPNDPLTLVAKTECPIPDGLISVIDLAVPSGRIIVADDLRPVYDPEMQPDPGYNSVAGQVQFTHLMAAVGCAYGPVGNTSPSLVRVGDGRYEIVSFDEDEGYGQETLASICTDLWAYSIADYDHWLSQGGDSEDLEFLDVVDVEPGVYHFTHLTGLRGFDDETWPTVYATIELLP